MRAYEETYLEDAMCILGEAFDYARIMDIEPEDFVNDFIVSGVATQFENGNPKYVAGMDGKELAMIVGERVGLPAIDVVHDISDGRSEEYWCGYAYAYCQWHSNLTYKDVIEIISASEMMKLYPTLHEASEEKLLDVFYSKMEQKSNRTRLQTIRKASGLSQKELAEKSNVSVRMIQQYEIRQKDINKASAKSLLSISEVLGCSIKDILEYDKKGS